MHNFWQQASKVWGCTCCAAFLSACEVGLAAALTYLGTQEREELLSDKRSTPNGFVFHFLRLCVEQVVHELLLGGWGNPFLPGRNGQDRTAGLKSTRAGCKAQITSRLRISS